MKRHCALIAGAGGQVGRVIAQHLAKRDDWEVMGLARRARQEEGMRWLALDLADPDACLTALAAIGSVTHVIYAARHDHPEGTPESVEANTAMLRNLVLAAERLPSLRHVHVVHGTKHYGSHLGPIPVLVREESPRASVVNFYHAQEDFLRDRAARQDWHYSISRPHTFCDRSVDHARSIGLVIAIYAALQRELGLPLDFPGTAKTYASRIQFTDLDLLAQAVEWMATEPRCANQAFNLVNGDAQPWSDLWSSIAEAFGLAPGEPRGYRLVDYVADKGEVWSEMVAREGLRATRLQEVALWSFGDYMFRPQWDVVSSMDKARGLGFSACVDTSEMFLKQIDAYRRARIIA